MVTSDVCRSVQGKRKIPRAALRISYHEPYPLLIFRVVEHLNIFSACSDEWVTPVSILASTWWSRLWTVIVSTAPMISFAEGSWPNALCSETQAVRSAKRQEAGFIVMTFLMVKL